MISSAMLEQMTRDATFTAAVGNAASIEDVIRIASEHSYTVSEDDVLQLIDSEAFADLPLSDAQLQAVAGGGTYLGSKTRNGSDQIKET